MRNWTKEEIDFLNEKLQFKTGEIYVQFCDQYGQDNTSRTYDSIQKKIKKLREAHSEDEPETIVPEPTVDLAAEDLAMQAIQQIRLPGTPFIPHVTAAEKRAAREDIKTWLNELVEFTNEEMTDLAGVTVDNAVQSPNSSLIIMMSDNHFGKQTASFNLKVARERTLSIPQQIYNRPRPVIDEVILCLIGDMVEGEDIYATQNNTLEVPVIDQAIHVSEAIWEQALLCRKLFDCPVRMETVPGNHGRMSKTANEKSNWDNVVYHLLRIMAAKHGDEQIIVNCNFDSFKTFRVKDKVGMLYHHGVKHMGTPAMQLKVAGWFMNKQFDFMLHGHWHEWHVGNWIGKIVVGNGCMCGSDDLSEKIAKEDKARQGFFYVTPGQPLGGFSFVEW